MHILITGGGGFIGFEAASKLKELGHDVAILDKNPNEFRWEAAKREKILRLHSDVLDINMLKLDKVDAIIHCGGQTAVTKSYDDPREDFIINARGTFEVCEFARRNDAQTIFMSSNKIYGENVNRYAVKHNNRWELSNNPVIGFTIHEKIPIDLTGHSPYGCSKLAADIYVQDYHHSYGLKTNVYRMSCIYGESQTTGTEDQGWVYHVINQVVHGREVKIFGDGCQVRDILHVDDLVELMKLTLKTDVSDVFNVGGGIDRTISVLELIKFVNPDYRNFVFYPWRPADQKVYISDIYKAKKTFGWEPKISKEDGLIRVINKLKMVKK